MGEATDAADGALDLVEDLLARDCRVRLRVTGTSMSPWLRSGEIVTLLPLGASPLRAGDIVLARLGDGTRVLHRLIGHRREAGGRERYRLKGDALRLEDGLVERKDVTGKVVAISRPGAAEIGLESPARRLLGRALAAASCGAPRLFARASQLLARVMCEGAEAGAPSGR